MMLRQAVSGPRSLPPHLHLSSLGVFRLPVSPSGSLRAVAPLPVKLETRDGEWYLLGAYCVLAPAGRCTRPSLDGETFAPLFRRHQRPSRRGPVGTGEAGIWSQDCLKPGTPLPARRWSFLCFCFALRSLCSDSVLHLRAPVEQGRRGAGGGGEQRQCWEGAGNLCRDSRGLSRAPGTGVTGGRTPADLWVGAGPRAPCCQGPHSQQSNWVVLKGASRCWRGLVNSLNDTGSLHGQ